MPSVVNCNLRLFADDSLLYKRVTNDADAAEFQHDLTKLSDWADTWQMSFNAKKCEHMRIARPTLINANNHHAYLFDNQPLQSVPHIKYLGITIDANLSFNKQVNDVCKKATGTLHMLMRNLKKARTKTRTIAYKTICRPILEYASHSWSPYLSKHVNQLESINRKAFRWSYKKRKFDNISDLMYRVGWHPLSLRRECADLCMYSRIITGKAAIDENLIALHHSEHHNTRHGATKATINTEVQRNSYRHRIQKLLNPACHRHSDL